VALSAALLLTLLLVGVVALWWRLEREARALADSLRRVALRALDAQRRADAQARLARAQQLTESAVDLTSATVRAVHRGIAAIPFALLANKPSAKDRVLKAQAAHDETAEAVYEGINAINRLVGRGVRRGIGLRESEPTSGGDPAAGDNDPVKPRG
jgi:hypothetical protein